MIIVLKNLDVITNFQKTHKKVRKTIFSNKTSGEDRSSIKTHQKVTATYRDTNKDVYLKDIYLKDVTQDVTQDVTKTSPGRHPDAT